MEAKLTVFPLRCPDCGEVQSDDDWLDGDLDEYDVLGCCEGQVMCQTCATEFDPRTGLRHERCEECDWMYEPTKPVDANQNGLLF
jgi:rubredoxin